jgi:hypothetical protein
MSYKFNVFDFLSFIVPGFLLILPILLVPSLVHPLGLSLARVGAGESMPLGSYPGVMSLVVFVVSYVLGLLIYYVGRLVERTVLERGAPPSRRVLSRATTSALADPVPERIRTIARSQFGLTEQAGDAQLFSLVFRHLFMVGKAERVGRFLHLRNLTRGATVVFFLWAAFCLGMMIIHGFQSALVVAALLALALTVLADRVRRAYNRDVAEEVYVAYYVHACGSDERGARSHDVE